MTGTKIIVGISEARISQNPSDILITYSLGSCIGVCLYEPDIKIGGLLHYQLPNSDIDPQRAKENPFMYADTGMKILIDEMISKGANKKRIQVKIAGGSQMQIGPQGFDIGKRNYLSIRKVLWKYGMLIDSENIGGDKPRNLSLCIDSGEVLVKINGQEMNL